MFIKWRDGDGVLLFLDLCLVECYNYLNEVGVLEFLYLYVYIGMLYFIIV